MATVTGLTAARMLQIEAASVVDGDIVGDDLILTKHDASTINAGNVRGPAGTNGTNGTNGAVGATGPQGPPGVNGATISDLEAALIDWLPVTYISASGYPIAPVSVSAETVVDRIVIPTAAYSRRVLFNSVAYFSSSIAATTADYILYSGATVVGRGRLYLPTAGAAGGTSIAAVSVPIGLAAGGGVTLEARVVRTAGTGLLTGSISSRLTSSQAIAIRQ